MSRLLAAALAGFCSLSIARRGEGEGARVAVEVVFDPFPLFHALDREFAGAEVGAEEASAVPFAEGLARLAEALNWQQPWPFGVTAALARTPGTNAGLRSQMRVTFSAQMDPDALDADYVLVRLVPGGDPVPVDVYFVEADAGDTVAIVEADDPVLVPGRYVFTIPNTVIAASGLPVAARWRSLTFDVGFEVAFVDSDPGGIARVTYNAVPDAGADDPARYAVLGVPALTVVSADYTSPTEVELTITGGASPAVRTLAVDGVTSPVGPLLPPFDQALFQWTGP